MSVKRLHACRCTAQIPAVFSTRDFVAAWGKFMEEVTEVMLEVTSSGHTPSVIRRLVDIDERIWDWTVNMCVHHPSTIIEAQVWEQGGGRGRTCSIYDDAVISKVCAITLIGW